jgi:ribosome-associated protein
VHERKDTNPGQSQLNRNWNVRRGHCPHNKMVENPGKISVPESEIEIKAIRAQGSGGQNVNKVSSAIHLRFDITASSLDDVYKERLLKLNDTRITREGVIVIKAQQYRNQEKNREDALRRLQELIDSIAVVPAKRRPTKPTRISQQKRLESKTQRGQLKIMRKKMNDYPT